MKQDRSRYTSAGLCAGLCLLFLSATALAGGSGGGGHHGFSLKEHGFYFVNFLVFVGVIVLLARKKIAAALESRAETMGRDLNEAASALEQAQQRETMAKADLEDLPEEASRLEEQSRTDGQLLADSIRKRTLAEAEKIGQAGASAIAAERAAAERELARELARRTLDKAELRLKQDAAGIDHAGLAQSFLSNLQSIEDDGGRP